MKNSINYLNEKLNKKGLNSEEWATLTQLRKDKLISMNRNPNCFELGSIGVKLKSYFLVREHLTYLK